MSRSASPSDPRPRRSVGRRVLRWTLIALAVLLALPVLLLAFLETGPGRRMAISLIEDLGSSPGSQIAIEGSDGSLFDRLTLRQVTLSDEQGAWLTLDEVVLDWSPTALFEGRLEIGQLAAETLALDRLPPPSAEPTPPDQQGGLLPDLPFALDIDTLEVGTIRLAEPLLGTAAVLSLQGTAALETAEARVDLTVTREDAPGFVTADLSWDRASERLAVELLAQEPPGGLATRVLGLPELPALELALDGEGSLADWAGELALQLDGDQAVAGRVTVTGSAERAFDLALTVEPPAVEAAAAFLEMPALPNLLPAGVELAAAGTLEGDSLRVRQLALTGEALALEASGTLDLAGGARDLAFALALPLDERRLDLLRALAGAGKMPELEPLLAGGLSLRAEGRLEGETLALETLALGGQALDLAASGTVDLAGETLDMGVSLQLPDGAALAPLLPGMALASANLEARLQGPFVAPRVELQGALAQPSSLQAALDRLTVEATAEPLGPDAFGADGYELVLEAGLADPQLRLPDLPPWPYGDTTVTARLRLQPGPGTATLESLSLQGEALDLEAAGDLAVPALAGELTLSLDARLPVLPELGPRPPRLLLDARVSGGDLAQRLEGEVAASLLEAGGLPDGLGDLLGPRAELAGGFSYAEGVITLAAASLVTDEFALDLDGTLAPSAIDLTWSVAAEQLSAALAPLGVESGGSLLARGSVQGDPEQALTVSADIEGEELSVQGTRIGPLQAEIALSGLPDAPVGEVALSAPDSAYGPIALQAEAVATDQGYRIDPLSVSLGEELVLSGQLSGEQAGLPLTGELTGSIAAGPLLEALGVPLQGQGSIAVRLTAPEGQQNATVAVDLNRGQAAGVAFGSARLEATLTDLLASPVLTATARLDAVDLGGSRLDSVNAQAEGALDSLQFSLQTSGDLGGPTELQIAGQLVEGGSAVRLTQLQGRLADLPLALVGSTTIELGDPITIAPTTIEVASGRLTIEGSQGAGGLDLQLRAEDIAMATLQPYLDGLAPSGRLDAVVDLGSRGGSVVGTAQIDLDDFALRREGLAVGPALDIAATVELGPGQTELTATLAGAFGDDLRIAATYPLGISAASFSPVVAENRPLSGSVEWQGRVGGLVDYLPLDNQELNGALALDIELAGTPAQPVVSGQILLQDGRYENYVSGTVIQDLTLAVSGQGSRLTIERASGTDGAGGRIELAGAVDLAAPEAASIQLLLTDFRLLGRDDLSAVVDGDLAFSPVEETPTLRGTLTGEQIEIDIGADLPASVPTLDVTVVRNGEPVSPEVVREEVPGADPAVEGNAAPVEVALDISVDLPRRVFVRGSGLDSEWAGKLSIGGTLSQPSIVGRLTPQRGQFEVLGNVFELSSGSITFDGGSRIDPLLDLRATNDTGEVVAAINVGGRASDPKITLTSSPPLPEEEVLARVLFSRGTGQLSPVEAVQLAEALASFSGIAGDTTVVERLRGALGLDVLRIGAGEGDDVASATAGRYIAEDVFVGVTQGTTPGSTAATVEIELTDDIVVQGKAGTESSVGIRWEYDY